MNKKIIVLLLIIIGAFFLVNARSKNLQAQIKQNAPTNIDSLEPAEKIEVVNFFGTQRCVSCLTIGSFTKKTLEEKFSPELESGKIVFKEINGELPENKELVTKYQARGSSLFINAIRGGKDDIVEDVTVWRLVNSEAQFTSYLENKLNLLLGK